MIKANENGERRNKKKVQEKGELERGAEDTGGWQERQQNRKRDRDKK